MPYPENIGEFLGNRYLVTTIGFANSDVLVTLHFSNGIPTSLDLCHSVRNDNPDAYKRISVKRLQAGQVLKQKINEDDIYYLHVDTPAPHIHFVGHGIEFKLVRYGYTLDDPLADGILLRSSGNFTLLQRDNAGHIASNED